MNGAHDMGGTHGFGPVEPEPDEPAFHADWERRVFAMTLAMGASGEWNIDSGRSSREDRPPPDYLSKSYFELWLAGLERLLAERGLVTGGEVAAGHALEPARPLGRTLDEDAVAPTLARGGPAAREAPRPARFKSGDRVRTRNLNPRTHTRLPRYARGRTGTVELVHGTHVFPDSNALGHGEDPQWLYTVRFAAGELWGPAADPSSSVTIDAFEPYLEPAP